MFYYDKEIDWQLLAGVKWPGQLNQNQKKRIDDNFNEMYHWNVQEIFMKTKPSAFGLHPYLQSRTDLQVVLKSHAKSYPYPSKAFRQVVRTSAEPGPRLSINPRKRLLFTSSLSTV